MLAACHSSYPQLAFNDMPTFCDARLPSEAQREALSRLAYLALLEMRILGRENKAAQVAELAEAFHNLPLMLWSPDFSMKCQREFFLRYHEQYGTREGFDYVAELDKIAELKD
ncbi:MAG: hypothetical protein IPK15_08085 [Verrucomicrobia bacterium]|nr:hypothetical protein [Verrucomicrobiota bacterium]